MSTPPKNPDGADLLKANEQKTEQDLGRADALCTESATSSGSGGQVDREVLPGELGHLVSSFREAGRSPPPYGSGVKVMTNSKGHKLPWVS